MLWIGIAIVILTFAAIIKGYETRLVLIVGGVVMGLIGGMPMPVVNEFSATLVNKTIVPMTCVTMGFSYVLRTTGCGNDIVNLASRMLKSAGFMILPLTVLVVWLLNISLNSASGLAAAVGVILIPLLIKLRLAPAIAGAAVLLGTWGSSLSPGSVFVVQVGELAKLDPMVAVMGYAFPCVLSVLAAVVVFTIITLMSKKKETTDGPAEVEIGSVNIFRAVIPIVPIVLLVPGSPMVKVIPNIGVVNSMLVGTLLCYLADWKHPAQFMKDFFKGMGEAFVEIICLMAAAAVFIKGMVVIGLVGSMIAALKAATALASLSAVFGPMLVAIVSGSGNAAILAFNGAVTPFAPEFGLRVVDMGMVAQTTGNLGRTMSPVAGVAIICAKLAGVSPMQLVRYTAVPCIVAAVVLLVTVFYI